MVLKSDSEESLKVLTESVRNELAGVISCSGEDIDRYDAIQGVVSEEIMAYDSRSNGYVEVTTRWIQAQARMLKSGLEVGRKARREVK